jgi:hypothetical protein
VLDELHLSISPFVAGSGESLLSGIRTAAMELTGMIEIGNGAVVLAYTTELVAGTKTQRAALSCSRPRTAGTTSSRNSRRERSTASTSNEPQAKAAAR